MANSKYGYVRAFEQSDQLLPNTFIVVRIDGRGFTKLTTKYKFVKPNDRRALDLMNDAAEAVMKDLPDLVLAYGQSDEFSFVFHKDCTLFERRASKLVTTIVSTFTANYVFGWAKYFPEAPLTPPLPSFDGRAVCYPSNANLRDYLSWRQADCHINNLYNTTFWALVQKGGLENRAAEKELSGTVSADKNEILFSRFGINYNNEPEIFKKGSVLYRDFFPTSTQSTPTPARAAPAQDKPSKPTARPMSQPLERSNLENFRSSAISAASTTSTSRGPTFLSTSTTPDVSPPASPVASSSPAFADGLSEFLSVGLPSTFTPMASPANNSVHRHALPPLTPIPLPPPTLKPSTRPPPSLNPPNPTLHTNTSPLPSPYSEAPTVIPSRTLSNSKRRVKPVAHSANASLSRPPPNQQQQPTAPYRPSPKRSPSLSVLETGLAGRSPPEIPLRISSIPLNAPPRKLSLPTQKSYTLLRSHDGEAPIYGGSSSSNSNATTSNTAAQRNNNASASTRTTPSHHIHTHTHASSHSHPQPLRIMKELPSPPTASSDTNSDNAIRSFVMGSEPPAWSTSPPPTRGHSYMQAHAMETVVASPIEPELEPGMNCAYAFPAPPLLSSAQNADAQQTPGKPQSKSEQTTPKARALDSRSQLAAFAWTPAVAAASLPASASAPPAIPISAMPPSTITSTSAEKPPASTRTNNNKKAKKILGVEDDDASYGNEGRPVTQSRTQREKERKKRGKARIITEHVDIIGEGFWERRGWVLSGRVG